jgi:outer membrane receptor for ferrienterochelin and colicins
MSRGTLSNNALTKKINYQVGYEFNHEWYEGSRINDNKQSITDYNVFASVEYKPIPKLVLRPGLRAIYNTKFDAPLIPSLNLKADLTEHIKLRASYAKGFRAPSLKELYLNFVDPSHNVHGNPNLKAENADNVQAFLSYDITKEKHVFKLESGVFYNHITNMIDLAMVNIATIEATYFNVGKFTSKGLNVNAEYRTPNYGFVLGYGLTGRTNSYNPKDEFYTSNEFRANFTYTHPKRKTALALFYKYNGKVQAYQYSYMNDEVVLGYIDAFSLLDASVSQPFWSKRVSLTVGVKNIFDVTNVRANISGGVHQSSSNNAMIAIGRNYFFSLKFNINKQL